MKRRLKISTYINVSMAFVLTVALALFAIVGAVLLRSAAIDNTVSSLQVALQTAYDRMELKDTSEILRISEVLSYENVNGYFASKNEKKLSKVLDRCAPVDMGTPYTVAVDSEGVVLASNAQAVGTEWPLSGLLDTLEAQDEAITSTELIPKEQLSVCYPAFRENAEIHIDETHSLYAPTSVSSPTRSAQQTAPLWEPSLRAIS